MIKVWLIEDLEDFRDDLRESFGRYSDIDCVGDFSNAEAALRKVHLSKAGEWPDVVLMDIQLPGMDGIEATAALRKAIPSVDVIILTTFGDKRRIFDAICNGASGYLLKTDRVDEIVKGIHDVHSGGSPLNSSVATIVLNMFSHLKVEDEEQQDLNDVERNIVYQLAEGSQKKEIAAAMDLEVHQVNYHVRNIYKKLQTNSLSGAVAKAIRKGLI